MFLFFTGFTLGIMVGAGVMVVLMISAHEHAHSFGDDTVLERVEFSSVSVFEDHRWGPHGARGCLTVPFLLSRGYQQDENGVVSGPPIPEDRKPAFWREK